MGRTLDALRRAEQEREARIARSEPRPASRPSPPTGALWRRFLPDVKEPRRSVEAIARLEDRLRDLQGRIDALDEKITKQLPETEGRLLHVLESALGGLRSELSRSVGEEIARHTALAERRAALGRAGIITLLLGVLFALALR